ncbi:MAG: DUF1778 domain-containing protein [Candidatus Rokubacteria bacterium]|nr:DUF1778 domain-containing protein [Candidatus Rokubacteria bacterium]
MPRTERHTTRATRAERLEARITKAQKELFVRAAELQGRSLTDFLVASAQEAALATVRTHDALRLSERDRRAFVAALLAPPRATKKLRQAVTRYRTHAGL